MATKRKTVVAIGLVSLACLGMVTIPDVRTASPALFIDDVEYILGGDSSCSQGCRGSEDFDHYGCMCPVSWGEAFVGGLTLTPHIHTPPGYQIFDVVVEDWVFTFGGDETEVTGSGLYQKWTDLEGNHWQSMTLDLDIYGQELPFSSGVLEDTTPSGAPPEEIHIGVASDTYCYGYWFLIDAGLVERSVDSTEGCAKAMRTDELVDAGDSP